ncbi:12379_t:CDS:1, partial [Acaulospora colombiana]
QLAYPGTAHKQLFARLGTQYANLALLSSWATTNATHGCLVFILHRRPRVPS